MNASPGSRDAAMEELSRLYRFYSSTFLLSQFWTLLTPDQQCRLGRNYREACRDHSSPLAMLSHLTPGPQDSAERLPKLLVSLSTEFFGESSLKGDWLLRATGFLPTSVEDAKAGAISRGDLVLDRKSRTVFWQGVDQEVVWGRGRVNWEFFLHACEQARQDEPIDPWSLSITHRVRQTVNDRVYHLRCKTPGFPQALVDCFDNDEQGEKRFFFPAEEIHIF